MNAKVYNLKGETVKEIELKDSVFNRSWNPDLVHQALLTQVANRRQPLAHAKGRAEVSGGGKKPWRQKGTGRARHGSIRSPIWKGGGITFGPTKERNFSKSVNRKVKNKALKMVLSDKAGHDHFILVENLLLPEAKTKKLKEILDKLPLKNKSVLIVLDKKDEQVVRGSRNLPKVSLAGADKLNVVDLLKHEYVLANLKSIDKISKVYCK